MPPPPFVRSLAGPQGEWPDEGAAFARYRPRHFGRPGAAAVARPSSATGPKTLSLDQLKIGQPDSVTLEGTGSFDRVNATGKLALDSSAASLGELTALDRSVRAAAVGAARRDGDDSGPGAA